MKKLLQEFKDFAMRGNVVDMAVGVVIGGAFGKVVTSVVEIFINPILEALPKVGEGGTGFAGSIISFLGVLVEFILTALILFLIIYTIVSLILHGRDRRLEAIPVGTFEQAEIRDGIIDAAIDTVKEKNAAAGEADLSAEKEENRAADTAEAAGVITAAAEENSVD